MYRQCLTLCIGVGLLLTACGNDDLTMEPIMNNDTTTNITKVSNETVFDQQPSNEAKDLLRKHDEITAVKAINTDKIMLIAIEIEHMRRFELADIQKKYHKEMKKQFEDFDVEFSADKKIIIELDKLEKQIIDGDISNKELKKNLKRIGKLSKEQT